MQVKLLLFYKLLITFLNTCWYYISYSKDVYGCVQINSEQINF